MLGAQEITSEFQRLGPWVTRFVIDGVAYGGDYNPLEDPRTIWCLEQFPAARSILDLGSLEGAQSFLLARGAAVERVVGIEARPSNLQKAKFVKKLLGVQNVEFIQGDLETMKLARLGRFDAVFCAGVLYHLPKPWRLVKQIAKVTDNLFLWTHFAADHQVTTRRRGYSGMEYREFGWDDPQSGLSSKSFWPDFAGLTKMLEDGGFRVRNIIKTRLDADPGPITALSAVKAR